MHLCRGSNYFEVDVDVASSRAANSVVGMVQGATNNMIIDMAIVLEGHNEEELPEALLGTVRFSHLDMKVRSCLTSISPGTAKRYCFNLSLFTRVNSPRFFLCSIP